MKLTTFKSTISALALSLAAFAASPALANDTVANDAGQEAVTATAAAETTDSDPALWVVKDEDTTIYMFGTVHILRPGVTWFDEAIKDAFDASDELVLEMVEPGQEEMQKIVLGLAVDPSGEGLRTKLTDEQRATYEGAMETVGVPAAAFDQFEPWFAGITLGTLPLLKGGFDVNSGAERTLTAAAKEAGKEITGLETPEQQLGYFDTLPEANQVHFLIASAEQAPTVVDTIDEMIGYWSDGDDVKLAELLHEDLADETLREVLLTKRNANWADWIDARMDRPGTVFVAVGAGHLAGEGSVQDMLTKHGFETSRVDY